MDPSLTSGVISISAIRACRAAAFDDGRKKLKFSNFQKTFFSNFFSSNFCQMLQIAANLRLSTQNLVKKMKRHLGPLECKSNTLVVVICPVEITQS